jgi:hypothetical protein
MITETRGAGARRAPAMTARREPGARMRTIVGVDGALRVRRAGRAAVSYIRQ